jgi:hypothetical protein
MPQTEITASIPVLDEIGRPQNFGWARSPCFIYDPAILRAPRRRISEGDRYILVSNTHLAIFELLDDGYLGYLFVNVISLRSKKHSTHSYITPFSLGSFDLPRDSDSDSIRFRQKKVLLNFANMEGGVKIIKADIPKFNHGYTLRGQVVLTPPPDAESLVTNMPWRRAKGAFSCTRRSPWYLAEGVIQFGIEELVFTRGNGWGIFGWSRGVRPRSDLRFWAAASGNAGERQVALSVGYNSADSSLGTENAFFLDGRIHKLDQVSFHVPSGGHLEPWRFTSNDKRLEMIFTPQQERDENHQMFFYSLKRRQLFGSFSGKVILDDGSEMEFHDIKGMTERGKSRL